MYFYIIAEAVAEVIRKKKIAELKKQQDNKLTLAQINGRISELQAQLDELEEQKRVLLNLIPTTVDILTQPIWYLYYKIHICNLMIKYYYLPCKF